MIREDGGGGDKGPVWWVDGRWPAWYSVLHGRCRSKRWLEEHGLVAWGQGGASFSAVPSWTRDGAEKKGHAEGFTRGGGTRPI